MARALSVEFPGAIYHAMVQGVARMAAFLDDFDRRALLGETETHVWKGTLMVRTLCLVINHFHPGPQVFQQRGGLSIFPGCG